MARLQDMVSNPAYKKLSPEAQTEIIRQEFKGFDDLSPEAQAEVTRQVNDGSFFTSGAEITNESNEPFTPQLTAPEVNESLYNPQPTPDIGLPSDATIQPVEQGNIFDRIGKSLVGAGAGVLQGVVPVEDLQTPWGNINDYYQYDPIASGVNQATRIPSAILSNIIGTATTGPIYPNFYGGVQGMSSADKATGQAYRSGNYDAAKRIEQNMPGITALNAITNAGLARLPGFLGRNLPSQLITGTGIGYGQDLAGNALNQYSQTGTFDPAKMDYSPGLGTILGTSFGALPQLSKNYKLGNPLLDGFMPKMPTSKPIGLGQVEKNRYGSYSP
jgi:hypothetical protein